jgi:hypothetical protein
VAGPSVWKVESVFAPGTASPSSDLRLYTFALSTLNSPARNSSKLLPRLNFPQSCDKTKQFRTIEVLVRYHLTRRNYCAILLCVCPGAPSRELPLPGIHRPAGATKPFSPPPTRSVSPRSDLQAFRRSGSFISPLQSHRCKK